MGVRLHELKDMSSSDPLGFSHHPFLNLPAPVFTAAGVPPLAGDLSMTSPLRVFASLVLALLLANASALAQITPADADFDPIPTGPWFDVLLSGTPDDMSVLPIANAMTIYPLVVPPGASGKLLRVDNSSSPSNDDVILRFTYGCDGGDSEATCRLGFGFVGWTFTDGLGVEFHVDDDGSYLTPDDAWYGSLTGGALEDGTVETTFVDAANCTSTHVLDVVVQGGALFIVDAVLAECLAPVSDRESSFGTIKSRFD